MLTAEPTRLAGLPMWILWDFSSYNCQCGNTILQPFTFQTSALESLLLSREEQRDERSLGELHSFFLGGFLRRGTQGHVLLSQLTWSTARLH